MIAYLDASVILALAVNEPGCERVAQEIEERGEELVTSPVSFFEAVVNYARIMSLPADQALERMREFFDILGVRIEPVTAEIGEAAIEAYRLYGRGSGHPAKLNMGDAFSYACAKRRGARLLYLGDDFVHTDMG